MKREVIKIYILKQLDIIRQIPLLVNDTLFKI